MEGIAPPRPSNSARVMTMPPTTLTMAVATIPGTKVTSSSCPTLRRATCQMSFTLKPSPRV